MGDTMASVPKTEARAGAAKHSDTSFMIPKQVYLDPAIAKLEKERLWPKVWQVAGREEELPSVGSFLTYEICDQSVIVMRADEHRIVAYHNVCQHRGKRLLEGKGKVQQVSCRFHGWRYDLEGKIGFVTERSDWDGYPHMSDAELSLKHVKVETWAGWIFVNFDPHSEPLRDYLAPIPQRVDCFEFEKMRPRWHKTIIVKCNWKVALEAFNEFYHVTATHAQLQQYQDDISRCEVHGDHGMMSYPPEMNRPWGAPAARTGQPLPTDWRMALVASARHFELTLKAIWSPRAVLATHRLLQELPADATAEQALGKMMQCWQEAAESEGAGWPQITPEQAAAAGYDWHVFPNFVFLMGPDAGIFYRIRPHGDDPERCIFDIWSMVRYVPGGEPPIKDEFYQQWQDCDSLGLILTQDFMNMEQVQLGMKSDGFSAARTNPLQESVLVNFHRALRTYLGLESDAAISGTARASSQK